MSNGLNGLNECRRALMLFNHLTGLTHLTVLPKMPRPSSNHPQPEQKIRDRVRGDGVTEAVFADDEPLKSHAAQKALRPFVMFQPEQQRDDDKRGGMK